MGATLRVVRLSNFSASRSSSARMAWLSAEGDTPETPTDANSETPAEETAQSNDEVESIDSGDVGRVDEVLNANDKEE